MEETFRAILLVALIAAFATTTFLFLSWWMESERRLRRAMKSALSGGTDMHAVAPSEGKAAGLDLENKQLAVLWDRGSIGLVFDFEEIEGAEVIVDGHVVGRVRRHLGRGSGPRRRPRIRVGRRTVDEHATCRCRRRPTMPR